MSDKKYKTVVQGEASESESSDEEETDTSGKDASMSVVVEGEATESEEEELDSSGNAIKRPQLPPLTLNEHSTSFESLDDLANVPILSHRQAGKPKYDTMLNRKLWESNLSLCNNLNGVAKQSYLSAAKEITNCGHQLSKSHAAIQDVSHNLRLLTNDLFNLDDGVDIITTCKILPNILLPEKRTKKVSDSSPPTIPQEASAAVAE